MRRAHAVKYERVREFLEANEVLDDLCREHGWATATFLVPIAGGGNEFVTEYKYPDLATFQAEAAAQKSNPDYMRILGGTADLVYPQSSRTDLYQNAPPGRRGSLIRPATEGPSRRSHDVQASGAVATAEDLRAEYQVRRDVRSRAFMDFIQAKLSAYAGQGQPQAT